MIRAKNAVVTAMIIGAMSEAFPLPATAAFLLILHRMHSAFLQFGMTDSAAFITSALLAPVTEIILIAMIVFCGLAFLRRRTAQ